MKTVKWDRILCIVLTLTMMLSMMIVFTVSGSAETDGNQYTLNVGDLATSPKGKKYDGQYEKAGTNNYFTIFYSEKAEVDPNTKTFPDGVAGTKRIAWGAKTEIGDQIINAIKIKTEGSASVKLWWVGGDPGRNPAIFNADGSILVQDKTDTVKNTEYVSVLEIPAAGIYYIGNVVGSNYFYQIEVVDQANGEAPAARADWSTVASPVISSAEDDGTGNIVVKVNALVGHDGADELLVSMYDEKGELVITKGSITEKSSHTLIFSPANTGKYTFKAELLREGEENKTCADLSADFVYVLKAPYISSATSIGDGKIEIVWSAIHEAEGYQILQNGELIDTVDANTLSYVASGLTIGKEYSYQIKVIRGDEIVASENTLSVTATETAKRAWGFTVYGPSTDSKNNGYLGSVNEDGWVTVYSENKKGKIQGEGPDGVAFYYTAVPTDYNFTLRAKIKVDSWSYTNAQEGFGLLATDRLGENGNGTDFWTNSYFAGSTKIEYKYLIDSDEIIDNKQLIYDGKYSMKLGIGTISKTGITKQNLSAVEGGDVSEVLFRNYTLERRAADIGCENGTYNLIGNFTEAPTGTLNDLFLVTEYVMEIQKNNSGYFISHYDLEGNLIMQKKFYDPEALSQLDEDFVYVGFCAARAARVTFSDIEFKTILASEDAPREYPPTEYITPTATVSSGTVTTSQSYELNVDVNVAGYLTIRYNNANIVENHYVEAKERFRHTIRLYDYGENPINIQFTPDPEQEFPPYTELSSTRTIYTSIDLIYNRGNYHRKTVYISPDVIPYSTTADGTKENPFDIFTALENAYPGQTLILMEGTYKPGTSLKIQRGMDGTADAMIRLIADPEAKTRPVIDFEGLWNGFVHGGDYWYFYGFDVTGSADMQKGFQISGNYNVLDQIHAYENGNTGIQLSRLSGSDLIEDWPSYNLVLNCTSYRNYDKGFEDADGFAAKLTVGPGNVFEGCVAYYNADDGWDLYAKPEEGQIGAVTIRNCVAYKNGFIDENKEKTGNGNGFKLGGSSISGKHVLENSIAFDNLAKGIDSNSCPDIIVYNCVSFNNGSHNYAFYTNNAENTAFIANGVISFRTNVNDKTNVADNLKGKNAQVTSDYINDSTYYWNTSEQCAMNGKGVKITADMFVSLTFDGWTRNDDGSLDLKGFLEIKDNVPENVKDAKLNPKASYKIELEADEECSFGRSWYNLDNNAHWRLCECGNKTRVEEHEFVWVIDKEAEGNQPGSKHKECTICGYKKAAITIYPETPVEPETPDEPNTPETPDEPNTPETPEQPEELGFFARIWQAILNFFRNLFGKK